MKIEYFIRIFLHRCRVYKRTEPQSTSYIRQNSFTRLHSQTQTTDRAAERFPINMKCHTVARIMLVAGILSAAMGYNTHRIYYKGQYINTQQAAEAVTLSGRATAQSIFRYFYNNIIFQSGM